MRTVSKTLALVVLVLLSLAVLAVVVPAVSGHVHLASAFLRWGAGPGSVGPVPGGGGPGLD